MCNTESFSNRIKIEKSPEEKRIEALKRKFEMGLIKEQDINEEDKSKMKKLYFDEIEKINKSIENYEKKLNSSNS